MSGGAMSEGHTRSASGAFGPEEAGFFGWDFDSHLEAAMALRTSRPLSSMSRPRTLTHDVCGDRAPVMADDAFIF